MEKCPNMTSEIENKFKVKLREQTTYPYSNAQQTGGNLDQKKRRFYNGSVVFDVSPDITESRSVNYKTMEPVHMPGQIHVYGGSTSRTYSLSNVKLISRTVTEATDNMQRLWTLRGWTMPRFGSRSSSLTADNKRIRRDFENGLGVDGVEGGIPTLAEKGRELLGKPPEVLLLSAYSSLTSSQTSFRNQRTIPTNIHNIPVVIQSLSIPYQSDVDYVPTLDGQPFPRVMILDLQLLETRAPREFSDNFSLNDYKQGILKGF
jgi:hypothetical protein